MSVEGGLNGPGTAVEEPPAMPISEELRALMSTCARRSVPATVMVDGATLLIIDVASDLPAFGYDGRRALVVITAEEYRELAAARTKLLRNAISGQAGPAARRPRLGFSTIERDAEVADFLRERFRRGVTLEELRTTCAERFGNERTPSVSRIGQFRRRCWGGR